MSNITIIGAGKTGRGFLADIIGEQEITFVDSNAALVEKLNAAKNIPSPISETGRRKERFPLQTLIHGKPFPGWRMT